MSTESDIPEKPTLRLARTQERAKAGSPENGKLKPPGGAPRLSAAPSTRAEPATRSGTAQQRSGQDAAADRNDADTASPLQLRPGATATPAAPGVDPQAQNVPNTLRKTGASQVRLEDPEPGRPKPRLKPLTSLPGEQMPPLAGAANVAVAASPETVGVEAGNSSSGNYSGLLIFAALLLLLLGSLGGIGYIIYSQFSAKQVGPDSATTARTAPEPPAETQSKTAPIAVATTAAEDKPPPEIQLESTPAATAVTETERPEPASPPSPAQQAHIDAVTRIVDNLHVDAVRSAGNQRVVLDSVSYEQGETVDIGSGLVFQGVRDGKLFFIDSKEIVYEKRF